MIIEGQARQDYILWKTSVFFGKCMHGSPLRLQNLRKLDTLAGPRAETDPLWN